MATLLIGLDAGHGLLTAGKQTPDGIKEWFLNDKVCDKIINKLAPYDVKIIRTDYDEGNTDESLDSRVAMYINAGVRLFISIHHNALNATWSSATGIEVYTDNNPTAEDTQLATLIHTKLAAYTGLKGRGVKKAAFRVINQNQVTAVLCEGGFMDGTNDYKVITSEAGQEAYARAVAEAIIEMYKPAKKSTTTTTTSTSGKAYKVVKTINRYANAADAQAKINAKGTYEAGTYYIYNKYPNGLNGMYNISKDSTGASAGSWINPGENVVQQTTTTTQQLYRIRKSWDDAKSQVGAFGSLENAKTTCQSAGPGYNVYDWNGKCVFAYDILAPQ